MSVFRGAVAWVSAFVMAASVAVGAAAPAAAAVNASLDVEKSVIDPQASYRPGETFTYSISVACSSFDADACFDTVLTDALPEPLVLNPATPDPVQVNVPGGGTAAVALGDDGRSFTVTPTYGDQRRLPAGSAMVVTASVQVPLDASADFNGTPIVNTATATAQNAPEAAGQATVHLEIVTTLEAGLTKTVDPASAVPAVPGRAVNWDLAPSNASNQTVERLVVTDPAGGAPGSPFTYLDFAGISALEMPEGAESVQIEWLDADGSWHDAYGPGPVPSDLDSGMPADPALVVGTRVTFAGAIAPGAAGRIGIETVTNDTVTTIPQGQTQDVPNVASASVGKGDATSAPQTATASARITASNPDVTVTKTFDPAALVSGQETSATITASNGAQNVARLTITEPLAGEARFSDQGLRFTGFGDDLEWPVGAASATVLYDYADCSARPLTSTERDTVPAPADDCVVEGFTLTFDAAPGTDGIVAAGYATLPVQLVAAPVNGAEPRLGTNVVGAEVENTAGQTGTATARADVTIRPLQVETEVSKRLVPDQVYAVGGADATISLSGKVGDDSTVGSRYLSISDPADPAAGPAPFWETFEARRISTSVPHGVSFIARYWSLEQQAWVDLAPAVTGPSGSHDVVVPADVQADLGGIQLYFEPVGDDEVLPPGFVALATIDVDVKAGVTVTDPSVIPNDARSEVHNENAVVPTRTADATDSVELLPIDGDGPDLVDKAWLEPDQVPALSGEQRTARLLWSTAGLPMSRMTLTDPASSGELADVSTSVYDVFDLVRIAPITPASDPLIAGDRVTGVWRYSAEAGTWVDITAAACAAGCDGQFGGYTLTAAERADTIGVRLEISEGEQGEGVGSSYTRRPVDLTFQVRDTLRSDPSVYALGQFHDRVYNTSSPGLVNNSVEAHGVGAEFDFTTRDADAILIVDEPLNLRMSKEFDQDVLGVPQPGTDADDYPLIDTVLSATNTTPARIQSMVLTDPSADQSAPTAYDVLDLHQISAITVPAGLTPADVVVRLQNGVGWSELTYWQALAATPEDLANVTGVELRFTRAGQIAIESGATGGATLTYQLREEKRSGGPVEETTAANGGPILNRAGAQIDSPGRVVCPAPGCSTGVTHAEDSFAIVAPSYAVDASKTVTPASVYEDQSRAYRTTLRGQPLGNARTTLLSLTDATPTFWNTMDFTGATVTIPRPVNEARIEVLVGADFAYDGTDLTYTCDGSDDLDPCWVVGSWESAPSGSNHRFDLPAGVTAADVIGVRFSFREVVGGVIQQWERPFNPNIQVELATVRRELLRYDTEGRADTTPVPTTRPGMAPAPGEPVQGTITNVLRVHGEGQFGPAQRFAEDTAVVDDTRVLHRPNAIRVEKSPGNPATTPKIGPAENIGYTLTVTNVGSWTMTGLELSDQIGLVDGHSPVVPVNGTTPFTFTLVDGSNRTQSVSGFGATLDEQTGRVDIQVPDGFTFPANWKLTITANLRFRPGLDPNTIVENTVTATSDRAFERCEHSVDNRLVAPTTHVEACAAITHVQPLAVAPLEMRKAVKGVAAGDPATGADDLGVLHQNGGAADVCGPAARDAEGYYASPCAPVTRPGGEQSWRIDFTNTGNTDARVVAAVDVLPAPGDQGVIVAGGRGSQWAPVFRGQVEANLAALADGGSATATAYYSTAVGDAACHRNAIRVHTNGESENSACGFAWRPVAGATDADLATARSVKFVLDFASGGLRPGETAHLYFRTQTPWVLPEAANGPTPIAYNSFAAASRTVDVVGQPGQGSTPLEPTKVGVATATGQLEIAKTVVAPRFTGPLNLPASYPMHLTCTSGGVPVPLSQSAVTVPADGSVVVNGADAPLNLPLFSECTVTETEVPTGATVSYQPTTQRAVADRDLATSSSIHHPYAGEVDGTSVEVVNTYSTGGFTVRKEVDAQGAVDQDGDPIRYAEEYGFEATCTYLDQEALPADRRSFTLADGETETFSEVPTGSLCRVTEVESGSSARQSVAISGAPPTESGDDFVEFVVGDESEPAIEVDVVNHYETGILEVTKQVTGEGAEAWGDQEFELRLVCELDTADPSTVYDATTTVSAVQPLWRVENLPAGADCVVTELGDGGATEFTGGQATVAPGDQGITPLTVTNRFDVGSITVRKEITGEGAAVDPVQNGTYTMTLTCTRPVSGTTLPIDPADIPGGAERVLVGASSATWSGLPAGASCAVAETGSEPEPTRVEVSPDQPVVVAAGADVEVVVENVFDPAWFQVVKDVDGPGAALTGGEFGFSVVCTVADQTVLDEQLTLTLADGETIVRSDVLGPLPIGTECVATETEVGGADRTPEPVQVVLNDGTTADEPLELAFTNWYSAGTLDVAKTLAGAGATEPKATEGTFTLLATCEVELSDGSRAVVLAERLEVRGDTVTTVAGPDDEPVLLPLGAHCFLAETDSGEADEVSIEHGSFEDAVVVVEGDESEPQALTLTAVNTFEATPEPGADDAPTAAGPLPDNGGPATGLTPLGILLLLAGAAAMAAASRRRQA